VSWVPPWKDSRLGDVPRGSLMFFR
jgi:hypothetical protein